ncbi:DDT domain-containing protein DDR4-like [Triticum urartu]|nr:DDT domain-containing protein DDR4-like [Triticum urartu]
MAASSPPEQDPPREPPPPEAEAGAPPARRTRPPRACSRPLAPPAPYPTPPPRRPGPGRPRKIAEEEPEEPEPDAPQCRVVTPLVAEPADPGELPRWRLRGMWELASVLNFLQVFRPLLNIAVEFTAEELEDALIVPNGTLEGLHVPLLRSIPPVARMSMADGKWVTVLCRKLKDWWHLVAEGNLPIVASHGAEIETYKELEPATRLMILKAICDIRCEQEDVRIFVDSCLKKGYQLRDFCKERIGGDSHGISYWYDEDPILGHRLYREIRQVEYVKEQTRKSKRKGFLGVPVVSYQWETVATNFVEFEAAAEKLFSSSNRTEVSLGKKLKLNYLPEMEKTHKKKEKLLKKQQREALLLNSYLTFDRFTSGRSHRERKRVTYTFDDYDRSINEALKAIKKSENPVHVVATTNRGVLVPTREASSNGTLAGPSPVCNGQRGESPLKSYSYQGSGGEEKAETLDRRSRQRKRSQRYTTDFVENVSDIDTNFDSDGDIMGEAVYDEEYLRSRKQPKASTSEYDGEFRSEDQAEYSLSSEDEEGIQRSKRLPSRSPQGTRLKSMDVIQTGIKRNKRSARPHMNHQRCSGKDSGLGKPGELNTSDPDAGSGALDSANTSIKSQEQRLLHIVKMHAPGREESKVGGRRFLHLNEIAPAGGFDGAPVRS